MTIGVLSWGAPKTLEQTLKSYAEYQLPLYDDDRLIFFQEISVADIQLAKKYGWKAHGEETNVGIAAGYKYLVEHAKGDTFLFLENDWKLIEEPSAVLNDARFLLSAREADLIRLRHRTNPGNPLWTRQFEGNEYQRPTHLLDSIHWTNPDKFSEVEKVLVPTSALNDRTRDWYITSSRYANWTNNPHMCYTRFIREHVLPHIGTSIIENTLQGWWEQQDFKVAQGQGLFTHDRID